MTTKIQNANISAPIIVNNASARVNASLATNLAQNQAYLKVTQTETAAYKAMKTTLNFDGDQLLKFIKVKTINMFNQDNLVVASPSLAKPVVTAPK